MICQAHRARLVWLSSVIGESRETVHLPLWMWMCIYKYKVKPVWMEGSQWSLMKGLSNIDMEPYMAIKNLSDEQSMPHSFSMNIWRQILSFVFSFFWWGNNSAYRNPDILKCRGSKEKSSLAVDMIYPPALYRNKSFFMWQRPFICGFDSRWLRTLRFTEIWWISHNRSAEKPFTKAQYLSYQLNSMYFTSPYNLNADSR